MTLNDYDMITEDYVSYKVARLLQEKGFDEVCFACYEYFISSVTLYSGWQFEYKGETVSNTDERVKCPTLQMAMKWLREMYNLHIEVYRTACGYRYIISDVPSGTDLYGDVDACDEDDISSCQWTTCEKASESAIKYCLENLISRK